MNGFDDLDWYDGAASGQQRSALMRLRPPRVMISYATARNQPWDNQFQRRSDYTLFVDSGGFHHMQTASGDYETTYEDYAAYVGTHEPAYWALRDYPCEPSLLDQHDRTVADHQQRTLDSAITGLKLADDEHLPGKPVAVLQGWTVNDYLDHIEMLQAHGCLTDYVGIGSICRRHETDAVVNIIRAVREALPSRIDLHAFGVKNSVLQYTEVVDALKSADSSAYDYSVSYTRNQRNTRFSYRDSLWAWLNWRRKLQSTVATRSLADTTPDAELTTMDANAEATGQPAAHTETVRDRVWTTVLELVRDSHRPFKTRDVLEYANLSDHHRQTVRKTLHSMAKAGWLDHVPRSHYWHPGATATAEFIH